MDNEPIKPDEEYQPGEQEHEIFQSEEDRPKVGLSSQRKRIMMVIGALVLIFCLYKLYGLFAAGTHKTTTDESSVPSVSTSSSTTPETSTPAVPANMPAAPSSLSVPAAVTTPTTSNNPSTASTAAPANPAANTQLKLLNPQTGNTQTAPTAVPSIAATTAVTTTSTLTKSTTTAATPTSANPASVSTTSAPTNTVTPSTTSTTQTITTQQHTAPSQGQHPITVTATTTSPSAVTAAPTAIEQKQDDRIYLLEQDSKDTRATMQNMQGQINNLAETLTKMQNSLNAINSAVQTFKSPTMKPQVVIKKTIIKQKRRSVRYPMYSRTVSGANISHGSGAVNGGGQNYYIKALIQGRAWLTTADGSRTITVSSGDYLPGYGLIEQIDPYQGTVTTGSGAVIEYNPADR